MTRSFSGSAVSRAGYVRASMIMADEPNTNINYYGSVVCAPYARTILEEALPYLGYYPEYTEEEYAQLDIVVPLLIDTDAGQKLVTEDGTVVEGVTVELRNPEFKVEV